ncbi:MAG: hypothetical protein HYV14_07825 [Elusimicrobia bacterium]|nr:hypothetical protein [Elusimicrobiota bacterium]
MSFIPRSIAAALLLASSAGPAFTLEQADLDKPLTDFATSAQGDFVAVCRALHTGCGVEVIDGVESLASRNSPLPRSGRTAREILDEYLAGRPHDAWSLENGVLNLRPATAPTPDWLSKKIAAVNFRKTDGYEAALTLLYMTGASLGVRMRKQPTLKPVDLSLKKVTVRQALNALAKADGEFVWIVVHAKPAQPWKLIFQPISFHEESPGNLNDANAEFLKVTERPVR